MRQGRVAVEWAVAAVMEAPATLPGDMIMTTTIQDIFREILPEGHSFSEARRQVHVDGVKFNGQQVTSMTQEVEVAEGSVFQVGKSNTWLREGSKWINDARTPDKS